VQNYTSRTRKATIEFMFSLQSLLTNAVWHAYNDALKVWEKSIKITKCDKTFYSKKFSNSKWSAANVTHHAMTRQHHSPPNTQHCYFPGWVSQFTPLLTSLRISCQGHFIPLWVVYITSNYLHAGGWSAYISSFDILDTFYINNSNFFSFIVYFPELNK
jgi:hypothetical protein